MLFLFDDEIMHFHWLSNLDSTTISTLHSKIKNSNYLTLNEKHFRIGEINNQFRVFINGYQTTESQIKFEFHNHNLIRERYDGNILKPKYKQAFLLDKGAFYFYNECKINSKCFGSDTGSGMHIYEVEMTCYSGYMFVNSMYTDFILHLLLHKKMDASKYPFNNDKDFLLI